MGYEMLGKNDIVHSDATLARQPDPFLPPVDLDEHERAIDEAVQGIIERQGIRKTLPPPPPPAPYIPPSPTAPLETTNVALYRALLPESLREAFDGVLRQVAYDVFEQGQEEIGMCCGCSGT